MIFFMKYKVQLYVFNLIYYIYQGQVLYSGCISRGFMLNYVIYFMCNITVIDRVVNLL